MVKIIEFWVRSQRERQVQKEEAQELTEKLDQEWKSIQALMVKKTPKAEHVDKQEEKPKVGCTNQSAECYPSTLCFLSSVAVPDICLSPSASSVGSSWRSTT